MRATPKRLPALDGQSVSIGEPCRPHPSLQLVWTIVSHVLGNKLYPHRPETTLGKPGLVVLDAVEVPGGLESQKASRQDGERITSCATENISSAFPLPPSGTGFFRPSEDSAALLGAWADGPEPNVALTSRTRCRNPWVVPNAQRPSPGRRGWDAALEEISPGKWQSWPVRR